MSSSSSETIAAIATAIAAGQGGIAVIRISGPKAEEVVKKVVVVPGQKKWISHQVLYGHVINQENDERIDEVLLFIMKAPRSFTGEDVVEIHCHGGLIVVQCVLDQVLAQKDVRRALPGEFSQRALLNGRLDLTRAEAISQLVAARSRRAAQLAMAGLDGGIHRCITALRERLLDQLSELEARIDFEEDLPPLDATELLKELMAVREELKTLIKDARRGVLFRNGLRVALIGAPNVGKSSLLNRLTRTERAIVTDVPGTTRDLLESEVVIHGVPIILLDTAGIRSTNDLIEQLGIDRSRQALASADIALLVFDLTVGWTKADSCLLAQIPKDVPKILIGNKVDFITNSVESLFPSEIDDGVIKVSISALTGEGEDVLINSLLKVCGGCESGGLLFALNERQLDLAIIAEKALARSQDAAEQLLPWDFWTIDLRQAIYSLGEITGEEITEAVLERIFSRFCIGK